MATYRDRVKELRRVHSSELHEHPENWRVHGQEQRRAMTAMLERVGIANAVLAYEDPEWGLTLLDGHMRSELARGSVPVLVLDVSRDEGRELLATGDPLSLMATADADALANLIKSLNTDDDVFAGLLADIGDEFGIGAVELEPQATDATFLDDDGAGGVAEEMHRTGGQNAGSFKGLQVLVPRSELEQFTAQLAALRQRWGKTTNEVIIEAVRRAHDAERADEREPSVAAGGTAGAQPDRPRRTRRQGRKDNHG